MLWVRARALPSLAVLVLAVACSSQDQVTDVPVAVTRVAIEGLSGAVVAGQSVQLKAIPMSAQGDRLTARAGGAAWQTSDANVATISSSGMLTGVLGGQVTISVSVAGVQSSTSATVSNPAPQVSSISPAAAEPGDSATTVTVTGSGFVKTSTVSWNGQARATTYVSATQLTFVASAGDLANEGTSTVTVVNPTPGGGASQSGVSFSVRAPGLTQIAVGYSHACALSTSGQAYCWGSNWAGQLGDGTNNSRSTPVAVQAAPTFVSITAGSDHTCGLSTAGQVYCWGANYDGQLGTGSTQFSSYPVAVTTTGFKQLTAGQWHTCALRADGVAFCWGYDYYGEIGIGRADTSLVLRPTQIQAPLRFRQLSAGAAHTCGVGTDHLAYCWGYNATGAIGNGTIDNTGSAPVTSAVAVQGGRSFLRVAGGYVHTCALTATGDAYCWGANGNGELGTGATGPAQPIPQRVSQSGFSSLAGGVYETCGVQSTGDVLCWGNNYEGKAGGPDAFASYPAPQRVTSGAVAVAAGGQHACATRTDGSVMCWGYMGAEGELGDGSISYRLRPTIASVLPALSAVAPGSSHSCGLTAAGQVLCWGYNQDGELGAGSGLAYSTAPRTVSGGRSYTQLSVGSQHSCAITSGKQLFCWGANYTGQVGDGTETTEFQPTPVAGNASYDKVTTGAYHSCALTAGQVQCWGYNYYGQVGNGTTAGSPVLTPTPVQGNPALISFGYGTTAYRTCGLNSSGTAICWGDNFGGDLGNGATTASGVPFALPFPLPFQALAETTYMTCGLTTSAAQLYCWGSGYFGGGTYQNSTAPVPAGNGMVFKQISAGSNHFCGLTPSGQAFCWGYNFNGQLGTGDLNYVGTPVAFAPGQVFQSIAAGSGSTCGVTTSGATVCAGNDMWGQLGDGQVGFTATPVRVAANLPFSTKPDARPCGGRGCVASSASGTFGLLGRAGIPLRTLQPQRGAMLQCPIEARERMSVCNPLPQVGGRPELAPRP